MLEIGDLFLKKSDYGGRALYAITTIAEDQKGTKLYNVGTCGYYTETQLYDKFDSVTILEEIEQCPEPSSTS